MSDLVRKLVVIAAIDGLILQPAHQRNQRSLQVDYKTYKVSVTNRPANEDDVSIDCHGIVGLLTVSPLSYLVAISGRQQVAQIRGAPVYVITDIVLIPVSSQVEATKIIKEAKESLKKGPAASDGASSDSELYDDEVSKTAGVTSSVYEHTSPATASPVEDTPTEARPAALGRSSSNVALDVIGRQGQYGRFAERWFSKKGWSVERRRAQGMSVDEHDSPSDTRSPSGSHQQPHSGSKISTQNLGGAGESITEQPENSVQNLANTYTLLPKFLRTTRMLLASRSFFFSYDLDITRRIGTQASKGSDLLLCKSVDPLFFWNHKLSGPFIDGGHGQFVLPLMQGFVGQRTFSLKNKPHPIADTVGPTTRSSKAVAEVAREAVSIVNDPDLLITLVSRRSIKRPGLRYLRRGVEEEGHTANSVETEQILSKASWAPTEKVYSFTQLRGSIPLFFSQSPYSFKPVPVLQHSTEVNQSAFKRHFENITGRYGRIQIVLLVDKSGGEKAIGEKYEAFTQQANKADGVSGKKLCFEWFDFHDICRGMKFENVSLLMNTLGGKINEFGTTVERNGKIESKQCGIIRSNCMDCLDRTNVVQSAIGQKVLEQQLQEGYEVDLRIDKSTQWFNTLWADNGDAISKQYSSTAALKGDFTRTRQRNYRGAINDFGLTLSRYYNNIVNDYFSQAAIDYLLGNVTAQVFEDFEVNLMSRDPSMSIEKVRENAINTSSKIVIEDSREDLVGGWALLSPRESNTVKMLPLEEVVLLVTDAALYKVCFDWSNEKVSSFERVDLRSITSIMKGAYITSVLTSAQANEARNVGFVVKYRPGKEDIARMNTRSLSNTIGLNSNVTGQAIDFEGAAKTTGLSSISSNAFPVKILAFKALPAQSTVTGDGQENRQISGKQAVNGICDEIKRAVFHDEESRMSSFIEEEDIVSLQEAKRSTGLVEQWSHSLKRMVWG